MDTNQDEAPAGDVLIGALPIGEYLTSLGMDDPDVYYLKRIGWPIGNIGGSAGKLIASKRRLARHVDKLARGTAATA